MKSLNLGELAKAVAELPVEPIPTTLGEFLGRALSLGGRVALQESRLVQEGDVFGIQPGDSWPAPIRTPTVLAHPETMKELKRAWNVAMIDAVFQAEIR